ncbi:hypothetical protein VM98_03015 [Streptomyces rubellomurinus subsp. indigoferus]|nr:hypothetical protein VM98_03015 [Streptomyces rubellomurinus subsp. indigoferus]
MATDQGAAASRGQTYRSCFAAFVLMQTEGYHRYARARLIDPGLSREIVEAALRFTERQWGLVLQRRSPTAYAWRILRTAVSAACFDAPDPASDHLHRALPADNADAALLDRLGLPVEQAAALMGIEAPQARADLLMAQRLLRVEAQEVNGACP